MAITLLNHNIRPYADLEAMLATSHKAMVVAATGAGKTSVALTAPTNEFVGAVRPKLLSLTAFSHDLIFFGGIVYKEISC